MDVLETRALGEDVGAAGAGGVGAADEGGRERCGPAHEGTGEVGADLPEVPIPSAQRAQNSRPTSFRMRASATPFAQPRSSGGTPRIRLPEAVV